MSEWEDVTPQRRASDGWEPVENKPLATTGPSGLYNRLLGMQIPEQKSSYEPSRQWGSGAPKLAYTVGSKVTDATTALGAPVPVAAGAGYLANIGMEAVPALFGGQIGKTAAPLLESAATSLMTSAMKPTLAQNKRGIGQNAVQTMLDEGLNATAGGVQKLKDRIGKLNQDISDAISNSSASVNPSAVTNALSSVYQKFRNQVNPQSDLAAIDAAKDAFINHPALQGMASIPVQLAQDLKQGTYRVLKGKYGQVGNASEEAQKAMARGLKEEIASAVPEVSALNSRESNLLDALQVAERRSMVDANKNPIGLAPLAHGSGGAVAAFLADRSALVKSLLARGIYSRSEDIPFALGSGVGGILGSISGTSPSR